MVLSHLRFEVHKKTFLFHDYLFVGGMPKIVDGYLQTRDIVNVPAEQYENLIMSYLADMSKHIKSAAESLKIAEIYKSIPRQLARENPKFKYKQEGLLFRNRLARGIGHGNKG